MPKIASEEDKARLLSNLSKSFLVFVVRPRRPSREAIQRLKQAPLSGAPLVSFLAPFGYGSFH